MGAVAVLVVMASGLVACGGKSEQAQAQELILGAAEATFEAGTAQVLVTLADDEGEGQADFENGQSEVTLTQGQDETTVWVDGADVFLGVGDVVTMADVLGIHGKEANPHLWYDVPRLDRIAGAIAAAFTRADPSHAGTYRRGLRRFESSLQPLRREVATVRARFGGAPVAYTEPVPGYLVAAAGLRNLAPDSFTRPLEEGTDPSFSAVAAMDGLVSEHRIRVLLYNSQAVSPITAQLRDAALSAGIRVVPVSETLPPHLSFQQWQLAQARDLATALGKR